MNQLFQQLNPLGNLLPNNLSQIKQMMQTINSASNQQIALQNAVNSNPQMKQVMNLIQQNGGDPKQTFYKLAQQRGINPDEIINMLK